MGDTGIIVVLGSRTVLGLVAAFDTVQVVLARCGAVCGSIAGCTGFDAVGIMLGSGAFPLFRRMGTALDAVGVVHGGVASVGGIGMVTGLDAACVVHRGIAAGGLVAGTDAARQVGVGIRRQGAVFVAGASLIDHTAQQNDAPALFFGCVRFCVQQFHLVTALFRCQQMGAVLIHAGDQAVTGGGDDAAVVHLEQLLHQLLVFPVLVGQVFHLGGEIGVRQGKQGGTGGNGLFLLGGDGGDGAGEGGGPPGVVDVQFAAAHPVAVIGGDDDLFADGIALVLHRHDDLAVQVGFHTARHLRVIGQGDADAFAGGDVHVPLDLHSHQAVQAQHGQRAVFQHHILHAVARFRVDHLHPAAGIGGDVAADGLVPHGLDLIAQVLQRFGNFGDGGHDGDLIHHCQRSSLCDGVAVFHQKLRDLHTAGNGHVLRGSGFQGAAAPEGAADGAGLHGAGEDAGNRAVLLRVVLCHQGHDGQKQHQHRQAAPDNVFF